ncbi:MAG TPA: GTP 3',8-cyclase MoaA [Gallionella sp.]|nr:MAG: cyclic pyranopterin phosphate synthase [Gallionellales bacterium GWA2_54_124]HCI52501.1 GTP 3',8-cyclase MoaA [Gallionella sp.]
MPDVIPIQYINSSPVSSGESVQRSLMHGVVLNDALHRPMQDLRISVTDRCNLRCTYCMPREIFDQNHVFLPRSELLTLEEIVRVAGSFVRLGVRKIRLTGGEPLMRRGIEQLVEKLSALRTNTGDRVDIAMTSNGVLLEARAQTLKNAGLSRITVSLDALDDAIFQRMTDSHSSVGSVLAGIVAAQHAGLLVKINMVVKRGVNDGEIMRMAEYFRNTGIVLRFVEYMDVGSTNGWAIDEVVPAREIVETISARYPLVLLDASCTGEVASRWAYTDGAGEIGQIASVTHVFCHDCTRIRLSTDGKLYTCLFAEQSKADLRALLRSGHSDEDIAHAIENCWQNRTDRYSEIRNEVAGLPLNKIEMSYIGG